MGEQVDEDNGADRLGGDIGGYLGESYAAETVVRADIAWRGERPAMPAGMRVPPVADAASDALASAAESGARVRVCSG